MKFLSSRNNDDAAVLVLVEMSEAKARWHSARRHEVRKADVSARRRVSAGTQYDRDIANTPRVQPAVWAEPGEVWIQMGVYIHAPQTLKQKHPNWRYRWTVESKMRKEASKVVLALLGKQRAELRACTYEIGFVRITENGDDGMMDDDNIGLAFKGIRDDVTKKFLGKDDAQWKRGAIQFSYGQIQDPQKRAGAQLVFKVRP